MADPTLLVFPRRIISVSPGGATLIFNSGFESPFDGTNIDTWDYGAGTRSYDDSVYHSGSRSFKLNATTGYLHEYFTTKTEVWFDGWVRFHSLTPATQDFFGTGEDTSYNCFNIYMTSAGVVRCADGDAYDQQISTGKIIDTWYHVFLHVKIVNPGSSGNTVQAEVNESVSRSSWGLNDTNATIKAGLPHFEYLMVGTGNTSDIYYFDDVRIFYGDSEPIEW